nr:UvrD-helicase domain-containing protein [Pseudomonas typographi]
MIRDLDACSHLLDNVESRALNDEQAKAVVCFDNRVQLIASAGSGKTSTMVAKAIDAVHRGFVAPSEIIMLAFNKDAAQELEARGAESLNRLGMVGVTINAMTFQRRRHAVRHRRCCRHRVCVHAGWGGRQCSGGDNG